MFETSTMMRQASSTAGLMLSRERIPGEITHIHSPGRDGSKPDLENWVSQVRSGDHEAFHAVFQRYSKPVLSFVYNLLGDRARAEEATQETFIRAYRKVGTMSGGTQLSTWLFGIARNVVRETIREKYKDRARVSMDEDFSGKLRDTRSSPDDQIMASELHGKIHDALGALSEDCQVVFVLKILMSMRYDEISKITGSSIGKLKTDLHRARIEMRQRLQPYLMGQVSGM
jgi:RNA polymerase sigma-70 factor (ECF subfamily)